jgi:hypothetical protein
LIYASDIFRKPTRDNAKAVFEVFLILLITFYSKFKVLINPIKILREYRILYFSRCMPI